MTRRERRRFIASGGVSIAVALLLTLATWNDAFPIFQAWATDTLLFRLWNPSDVRDIEKRVVIVAIDDASVDELGRFGEWPRRYYTDVIDRIREANARGIVFDVGFVDPNADDADVAASMQRFLDVTPEEMQRAGVPITRHSIISPVVGVPFSGVQKQIGQLIQYPNLQPPLPVFVNASSALGQANVIPDDDGVVRKTPLILNIAGQQYPSVGLAAAAAYTNTAGLGYTVDRDAPGVHAGSRFIPSDEFLLSPVSFAGPPSRVGAASQAFTVVSFSDVRDGKIDPSVLRDRMAFIGVLGLTGYPDDYWVPTSTGAGKMAGVEIHASSFATIVSSHFVVKQQPAVTIAFIWLMCLITGVAVFRLSIILSSVGLLLIGVAYFLGSFEYATSYQDLSGVAMPNVFYPPAALLLTYLAVTAYRVAFEQAEVRATRGAMGKYLSPAILEAVMRDPDSLHLGGEKRVMTVLFTDIRGFTSISEQLDPETLVSLLNDYLTVMTNIVHRWNGVLDKYMGDAIMAWWGAPTDQPDHAYRACMTALEMRAALHDLHEEWAARNVPKLEMGVGINTGLMVYGNTGSLERFDFTVLGDAVNLASRLEGMNKEYASNVIVSDSTREEARDRGFLMRYLDIIEVKGKTEPSEIYELLGRAEQLTADQSAMLDAWESAIALYRARDFALAEDAFRKVLALHPGDGPATKLIARCQDLRANPPAPDWDGVFVMTHK